MGERLTITIEYDVTTDMQTALSEAVTQIREHRDRLNPEHLTMLRDIHVAILDMADKVLTVFDNPKDEEM
jgi:hypothetical protein